MPPTGAVKHNKWWSIQCVYLMGSRSTIEESCSEKRNAKRRDKNEPGQHWRWQSKIVKIRRAILHPKKLGGACLMDIKKRVDGNYSSHDNLMLYVLMQQSSQFGFPRILGRSSMTQLVATSSLSLLPLASKTFIKLSAGASHQALGWNPAYIAMRALLN
jgi:hypothetical protein